jgi:hypothetical protein
MRRIKTADLDGVALDWAVAKAEGFSPNVHTNPYGYPVLLNTAGSYASEWALAGPIIAREDIATFPASYVTGKVWCAVVDKGGTQPMCLYDIDNREAWWFEESEVMKGPSPLVAAMRCYVSLKLGPEIDVPEALVERLDADRNSQPGTRASPRLR